VSYIAYRKLDSSYEPVMGQRQNDFLFDLPAVAQAVKTRLNLWANEWFMDLNDGLPMLQGILGVMGAGKSGQIALLIQQRILGTPFVSGLSEVSVIYNSSTRAYSFSCVASVNFGGQISVVGTYNNQGVAFTTTPIGG
jgi:hypothetical protein